MTNANRNRPPRRWFIDWPLVVITVALSVAAAYDVTHRSAPGLCILQAGQP